MIPHSRQGNQDFLEEIAQRPKETPRRTIGNLHRTVFKLEAWSDSKCSLRCPASPSARGNAPVHPRYEAPLHLDQQYGASCTNPFVGSLANADAAARRWRTLRSSRLVAGRCAEGSFIQSRTASAPVKLGELVDLYHDPGGLMPTTLFRGEALAQMLEKRRVQAGLRRLTWHDFRRTFAGNLLDNGNDLVTVQKLMGHASPTTTAAYDRRGEEVKRRASRSLHVPYPGGRAK